MPNMRSNSTSTKYLVDGTKINFSISFDAPSDCGVYKSFTLIDYLAEGISFDKDNTVVKVNDSIISNWEYVYDENERMLTMKIPNCDIAAGKNVTIILATILVDKSLISEKSLNNTAKVLVNGNSDLTNTSNIVEVIFEEIQDDVIVVEPESENEIVSVAEDKKVAVSMLFNAVTNDEDHRVYNIITTIPEGCTFVEEDSSVSLKEKEVQTNLLRASRASFSVRSNSASTPKVEYVYDESTRKLSVNITNSSEYTNKQFEVTIGMQITNTKVISGEVTSKVQLGYNSSYIVDTKELTIEFVKPISIAKTVDNSKKYLKKGTSILYTATFEVPTEIGTLTYATFKITDELPSGLTFVLNNSSITTSDGRSIEGTISYPDDGKAGEIEIQFYNYSNLEGKTVNVNIGTILEDVDKIPENLIIYNKANLIINGEDSSKSSSNSVKVKFITQDELDREQALTNVIESIALIENGLASILYDQGDAIELGEKHAKDADDIIKINESVDEIASSIIILEQLLSKQLKIADS